jgi:hypothetical protein
MDTLSDHKRIFDDVKEHLEKNRRLTRKQASRFLAGIRKKPIQDVVDLLNEGVAK